MGVPKERMGERIFSSWNVKGINEPFKRGKVLAHLKSLNSEIIFLQETHLKKDSHLRLRCKWISQVYHSSFPFKTRGVAIMIRKGVLFKSLHHCWWEGKVRHSGVRVVFQADDSVKYIYGPNQDDPEFFQKVLVLIPDISGTNLIIGGDFTCVLDQYLDRSSAQTIAPSNSNKLLNTYVWAM